MLSLNVTTTNHEVIISTQTTLENEWCESNSKSEWKHCNCKLSEYHISNCPVKILHTVAADKE